MWTSPDIQRSACRSDFGAYSIKIVYMFQVLFYPITTSPNPDSYLHHKPGKTNIKVDILSRWADHNRGENDNEDITMLKLEWFRQIEIDVTAKDGEFIKRTKKLTGEEWRIDRVVEKALLNKEKEWAREGELITWQNHIYIPKDRTLREDIIRTHHDSWLAGHSGRYKTQELITRNYWWPYIQSDIRWYIDGCQLCQKMKTRKGKIHAPLQPNAIPESPWEHISVDLITNLPISNGYNAILVVVDRFSKYIMAIPASGELLALGTARLYRDRVWSQFGIPRKIISDRGPQFTAQFMKDLHQLVGTEANISTAFHPQTDGQTERINQEIEQYLRLFTKWMTDRLGRLVTICHILIQWSSSLFNWPLALLPQLWSTPLQGNQFSLRSQEPVSSRVCQPYE